MAASPKSMWAGSLRLGLLNVPITIGKAAQEQKEKGLVTVCADHKVPINRSERCGAGAKDCSLTKSKAVQKADKSYHVFSPAEVSSIEDSTKSDTLDVLDVQPLNDLPMEFGMGTYYVRADKKVRGSEQAFSILALALAKTRMGMVAKLCRSASQKLVVLHASEGMILLTQIPMLAELRKPGDDERAHWKVEPPTAQIDLLVDLLNQTRNSSGFDWAAYEDEGYRLRTEAVDRVLAGDVSDEADEQPVEETQQATDLMQTLMASIEKNKAEAEQVEA